MEVKLGMLRTKERDIKENSKNTEKNAHVWDSNLVTMSEMMLEKQSEHLEQKITEKSFTISYSHTGWTERWHRRRNSHTSSKICLSVTKAVIGIRTNLSIVVTSTLN